MSLSRQRSLVKPLEPSSCAAALRRPERLDARGREIVDDAGGQRRLRSDHDEIDLVAPAESDHRGMIRDIERHAFGFARDAGVARRAPEFRQQRGRGDFPGQRVFAAAGTEQKNVHGIDVADAQGLSVAVEAV